MAISRDMLERLIKRFEKVRTDRGTWESHWQDIVDYVIPRRANITSSTSPGQTKTEKMYNETAPHALELLAAGLHGMLTNPSIPWFALETKFDELNEMPDVRGWLQDVQESILDALSESNWDTQIHEVYLDLGSIGTSCLYCEEGDETDLEFSARHISEYFPIVNRHGEIDILYRLFDLSARNMVARWEDECSETVKDCAKEEPEKMFKVLHIVMPREEYDHRLETPDQLPIASIYVEHKEEKILEEGGYHEMAYAIARWYKMTGEDYGRSPAMTALPVIKMVNAIDETTIRSAQKRVDPPLQMPSEGFHLPIKIGASGVNFYDAAAGEGRIEEIGTAADVRLGLELIQHKEQVIRSIFMNDMLQMIHDTRMTATEVLQRMEERLRLMGPILGRLQSELLRPVIDRVFGILLRAGRLPAIPDALLELAGEDLKVVYISPIARAQKLYILQSIQKAMQNLAPIAQIDPSILDRIDADKVVDITFEVLGTPLDILRPDEEVQEIREARRQQIEIQQRQEAAMQAVEAAKTASETDPRAGLLGAIPGMEGIQGLPGALSEAA